MTDTFGHLADGRRVERCVLEAGETGLRVELLTYGCIVHRVGVPLGTSRREAVVGFDSLDAYEADASYQGCIVGRLTNRIAGAAFDRDGQHYRITANEAPNALHGGARGLSRRIWQVAPRADQASPVVMTYVSPDGEEGFPGTCRITVQFSLPDPLTLRIDYEAVVDRDCPVDLTHHIYFNLGSLPVEDHVLRIGGASIQEVDAACLATGVILPVAGTLFDLRRPRTIGAIEAGHHPQLTAIGLNQNWVLAGDAAPAAMLTAPDKAVAMELTTDNPCLQVWAGLARSVFAAGAVALEPQGFIGAVNYPDLPSPWLRPGEVYRRATLYRFRRPSPEPPIS